MVLEEYFNTIKEFKETIYAKTLIKNALRELFPVKNKDNKKRNGIWEFILSIGIALLFAFKVSYSPHTIKELSEILDKLIDIELAIFGAVFTAYTILLAVLGDFYLKKLAAIKVTGNQSYLNKAISYMSSILFLWFVNIGISSSVYFFTKCIDEDWGAFVNIQYNNLLSTLSLFFLFWFSFRVFIELKSTIFNLILLLRASIAYRFISFQKEALCCKKNDNKTK